MLSPNFLVFVLHLISLQVLVKSTNKSALSLESITQKYIMCKSFKLKVLELVPAPFIPKYKLRMKREHIASNHVFKLKPMDALTLMMFSNDPE